MFYGMQTKFNLAKKAQLFVSAALSVFICSEQTDAVHNFSMYQLANFSRLILWFGSALAKRVAAASDLHSASMLGIAVLGAAFAALPISAQVPKHPWLAASPKYDVQAYFTNLSNGATVQSPFVAKFGMTYWGIAPAGQDFPLTGHHHLLIDQPLPLDVQAPLPFSERYVHFGKGQMEAVINLPPGRHTLRLLLADHSHRPHFVFSPALTVEVLPGRSNLPPDYGTVPLLELLGPSEKPLARQPFRLVFHAIGLNVAPKSSRLAGTGVFRVRFTPRDARARDVEEISFPNGQTEAWFLPPRGSYNVQLLFETNPNGKLHPVVSAPISVTMPG